MSDKAFQRMETSIVWSERGDGFLYLCARMLEPSLIRPANAYVARMRTGCYWSIRRHEGLSVLHLPAEKTNAFPRALASLQKGQRLVLGAWYGLKPSRRPSDPAWVARRTLQKAGFPL